METPASAYAVSRHHSEASIFVTLTGAEFKAIINRLLRFIALANFLGAVADAKNEVPVFAKTCGVVFLAVQILVFGIHGGNAGFLIQASIGFNLSNLGRQVLTAHAGRAFASWAATAATRVPSAMMIVFIVMR